VLDRVVTEFGQGPAAVGETDHRRRLVSESAQGNLLLGGNPRWRSTPVVLAHPVQPRVVEGVQVGLNRMRMQSEEASDRGRIPTLGMQHDGFGAAQRSAVSRGLQQLPELTKFSGGGAAGSHGAGHSGASEGES
jgi:hypothetical protein